jgi:hypothetical protein
MIEFYTLRPTWTSRDENAALQWAIENLRNNAHTLKDVAHAKKVHAYNMGLVRHHLKSIVKTIQRGDAQSVVVPESLESAHRMDQEELLDLIAGARVNSAAHEYLLAIAAALTENGQTLPAPLKEFLIGFLRNPKPPRPGRGRKRSTLSSRDSFIAWVVGMICLQWRFYPTRNESSETPSAVSITKRALREIGINLTEATITKMWANSVWKRSHEGWKEIVAIE